MKAAYKTKLNSAILFLVVSFFSVGSCLYAAEKESPLFWPSPPAEMRISFVKSVYSGADFGIRQGFLKKLKNIIFGEEKDILNKPLAVAVDSQKTLYCCDPGGRAFHIFMVKEKKYKRITKINKEELMSPVSVAVSDDGLIFIADSVLRKIFCIDSQGRLKFAIGENNQFLRPTGLAISRDKLYVVDTLSHNICVFDLSGKLILKFGDRGKGDGQFNYPTYIARDDAGKIYVVDTLNFRIQVFDERNKFMYSIGQLGDSSGSFSRPKGVALDSFGHIYVTDGVFDNIQIFGPNKEFLLSLGESGHKDGEFWIPCGVAIDGENYIYIADSYNQRIQILRYVGKD